MNIVTKLSEEERFDLLRNKRACKIFLLNNFN